MKKTIFTILGGILVPLCLMLSLVACGNNEEKTIGISMPTQSSERWILDAKYTVLDFEEKGYEAKIAFAEDVVGNQAAQIANFIDEGVDMLVIAPIDAKSLNDELKRANEAGIPVIAYDRLIMGSEYVDYYITFDNIAVGRMQGEFLVDHARFERDKPVYLEVFAGSEDDNNARMFFDGAMEVIRPYIEEGKIQIRSHQFDFKEVNTLRWDKMIAKSRMTGLLDTYYKETGVNLVLSPYDGISRGIIEALEEKGYALQGEPYITGQDAELASVQEILEGKQSMTVFKDVRMLAKKTVDIADQILRGETLPQSDAVYDNWVMEVPTYLLEPKVVTRENWGQILVESGYYSRDEVLDTIK